MIDYIKAKNWDGNDLTGQWLIDYKIDGVRAIHTEDGWVSRNNKPLYNLQEIPPSWKDIEVYDTDWSKSVSLCRTKVGVPISTRQVYKLANRYNKDLSIGVCSNPLALNIDAHLVRALSKGYEGLVLKQGDTWLKVKPVETYDVKVIGVKEGKGKNANKLGAFITDMGNVGTGFTDEERQDLWRRYQNLNEPLTIEVECMELTPNGKFRHPRFVHIRFDK
tara:strand:+ start:381 stop:1040 length:660 start_codon:yes stop_codon:yes gene_type:complete